MAKSQARSIRKVSGKKYVAGYKTKQHELGGLSAHTTIAPSRVKVKRVMGGNEKRQALSVETVIVNDGAKTKVAKIETVVNNPANINLTRRNVITKGAIVKTDLGEVVITSRPGQTAQVFGKLIQ